MHAGTLAGPGIAADPRVARGLSNHAYTSAEQLETEHRRVLSATWIPIGLEDDVAAPGSACPVTAAGQPLLLVRDRDATLRVFHNVCRHRGTCLVTSPGARARLVCPYHGWTYALDGALESTPGFAGGDDAVAPELDRGAHGLAPVRCGVWGRVVFANLDGAAPPLDEHVAALAARWAHVDLAQLRLGREAAHEVGANWKLVTENFLESYHLPTVHRGLDAYSNLADHRVVVEGDSFFGQHSARYAPADDAAGRLPRFPGLSAEQARASEYLCLFPTGWFSIAADHFRVTILEPVSPTHTRLRWAFYFVGDGALDPEFRAARETLVNRVLSVFDEDVPILERLQLGRTSGGFDGGCFSARHEQAVHRFQRLVAGRCAGAGAA